MRHLKKSFVLLLLVFTNQLEALEDTDRDQVTLDYHNPLVIDKHETVLAGDQLISLEIMQLIMLLITCAVLIYTFYKLNKDRKELAAKIEQISRAIANEQHTPVIHNNSNIRIKEVPDVQPKEKEPVTMKTRDVKWLENLDKVILNELSNTLLKPMDIAAQMGVCERQLQRKLKQLTGTSPTQYLNQVRLKKGYDYLKSGDYQTISEVAYKVGYKYPDYFSKSFKKFFGQKPNELLNSLVML